MIPLTAAPRGQEEYSPGLRRRSRLYPGCEAKNKKPLSRRERGTGVWARFVRMPLLFRAKVVQHHFGNLGRFRNQGFAICAAQEIVQLLLLSVSERRDISVHRINAQFQCRPEVSEKNCSAAVVSSMTRKLFPPVCKFVWEFRPHEKLKGRCVLPLCGLHSGRELPVSLERTAILTLENTNSINRNVLSQKQYGASADNKNNGPAGDLPFAHAFTNRKLAQAKLLSTSLPLRASVQNRPRVSASLR